jgi:hypothetical protein
VRKCKYCNKKLIQGKSYSYESETAFKRRVFCDRKCIGAFERKTDRNKKILKMFKTKGLKEIAKEFGVTTQAISLITRRAELRGEANFRKEVRARRGRLQ